MHQYCIKPSVSGVFFINMRTGAFKKRDSHSYRVREERQERRKQQLYEELMEGRTETTHREHGKGECGDESIPQPGTTHSINLNHRCS